MKYTKSLVAALAIAASAMMTSCDPSDFGDLNETPNNPQEAYTTFLFRYAAVGTRSFIMSSSSYDPWAMEWPGYLAEAKNNQYGPLSVTTDYATGSFYYGPIKNLSNIIKSCEEGTSPNNLDLGSLDNQIAAATTLRAFYYMTLSDIQGPIVYTEALQATDENYNPKLDTQEFVYTSLLKDLEQVYAKFDPSSKLASAYDYFFKGSTAKWMKFNASLRMMMAIKLADIKPEMGKQFFAKAFADGGMESVDDSFNYSFDSSYASAWFYAIGNQGYASRSNYFAPNKVLVDALKEYKDPRLFTYATIGQERYAYLGKRGTAADEHNFDAYQGIPHGLESNTAVSTAVKIACSTAPKYCERTATYGLITTARTKLVEAEAAVLGWIDADASALYEQGIQASFDFEAKSDAAFDPKQATDYIAAHPLPTDKDEALHEIIMQRFLAGFLTDGIEAWSDWRRYNIPTIPMYQGQINDGHDRYPQRLRFAAADYSANEDNIKAVLSDVGGKDDAWGRVWWDVEDNPSPKAPGVK